MIVEGTLIAFLLILSLGLIVPELLKKFNLPIITLIILAGAIFGPNGLNYIYPDSTIEFLGFLGMTFLMLMAGLDTEISKLRQSKLKILILFLFNGFIPFIIGIGITRYFGYDWIASLLVGIIFISSSVAIIIPYLKSNKVISSSDSQLFLAAILIADMVSLVMLGIVFQNIQPITNLPLPLYFLFLFLSIPILFYIIPKISNYLIKSRFSSDQDYEQKLRFVLIILISILLFFSFLGVHPLLAAFMAGLSLSSIVKNDETGILYAKLHTIGYGLFVPVFFFIVGMDLDLKLLSQFDTKNIIMMSIIFGLIISKIISGYIGARFVNMSKSSSLLFGTISITQLTTTLAVTYSAASLNIIDDF